MIITRNLQRSIHGPEGETVMTLNAFGFVNNTCSCADFGFLPEPEWSHALNQPYCRCDTRKNIKYYFVKIFEIRMNLRLVFSKVATISIIWIHLLRPVIARTSLLVQEINGCKYPMKMK